jgi:hypothetical protein
MRLALLKRVSIYTVCVLTVLTAIAGLLHTKAGRPLLARWGLGCPMRASPEAIEAARINSARTLRGSEVAALRPALGFALDTMTLKDVKAWAVRNHLSCEDKRVGFLQCDEVPLAALGGQGPAIGQLQFGFSPASERLVNITAWRSGLSGEVAAAQLNTVATRMREQLGVPTREAGARSAAHLAAGAMHTAIISYRFKDYIADVSATNIPGRGLTLREHYMSARD